MTFRPLALILGLAVLAACTNSEAADAPPDGMSTDDAVAYGHYVAASDFLERRIGRDDPDSAVARFTMAVEADPEFAEAWAGLSQAHMWLHFNQNVPGNLGPAQRAAERAAELDPDGVETHLARGYVAYWGQRDFDAALTEFLAAEQLEDGSAEVAGAIGNIYRRQGRLDDAIRYYERRVELAPDLEQGLVTLAGTYGTVGRYDAQARTAEQLIELGDARGHDQRFWAHFNSGDTAQAWALLPEMKAAWEAGEEPGFFDVFQAVVRRDDAAAVEMIERLDDPEDVNWGIQRELAGALARAGQASARAELIDAWIADQMGVLDLRQASDATQAVQEATRRSRAAWLAALRGDRETARQHAERAEELDAFELDAVSGSGTLWNLANTHMLLGNTNRALEILEELEQRDYLGSTAWMELHPSLDPLRRDARFTALIEARQAKETGA